MEEIPSGFTHRTTSGIPRRDAIRDIRSKADDLQRSRDGEINNIDLTNVKSQRKFKTSNTNLGKKVESTKVQPQYNASFNNPYMAQSKNQKLAQLIEERARNL